VVVHEAIFVGECRIGNVISGHPAWVAMQREQAAGRDPGRVDRSHCGRVRGEESAS
jgi:hypothetical protein